VEDQWATGGWTEEVYERWKKRLEMTESELEAHLRELYPGGKLREQESRDDQRHNNPSQPVAGVSWYEACAYCHWLSAQTGQAFRLPTEAEWEAAARGKEARRYAWGNEFDPLRGNTMEARFRRATPVGVFVEGETPEGLSDLTGNVSEWTGSLFGNKDDETTWYRYPYLKDDGREDPDAGMDVARVLRGGSWYLGAVASMSACRLGDHPCARYGLGFRLASDRNCAPRTGESSSTAE
jgi:formylglycine-generating enzyme required for sulfatase activity